MISTPGIGSGLDVNNIVSRLIAIERRPLSVLDAKEAVQQTQLTAFGSLKGALSSFQSNLTALSNPASFSAVSANLADRSLATVGADASAIAGSYDVEIQTLAQSHKLKSENFASSSTTVGSGSLSIQFGAYSSGTFTLNPDKAAQTITIDSSQASLVGIRDAINQADTSISASIINDGSGDRLVIASKDTGLNNALKITTTDDDANNTDDAGLSQLVYDASTGGTTNLTETVAAGNATLVIDGIAISKASNTLTDTIEGVTLDLLKTNVGESSTLNITQDKTGAQSAAASFVNAFNDLNRTISDFTRYDSANNRASVLTGDFTTRSIQTQIRNAISDPLTTAGGGLSLLSEVGISFQVDGTLTFDASKFSEVADDTSKDLSTLFASVGKTSDSFVSFVSASSETINGKYSLAISQTATQGTAVGNAAAALTINAGVNDTLDLTIDGVNGSVTLAAGTYTAASLAAEIQSQTNGVSAFSSAAIDVTVTAPAGVLTITSNRYGSASKVEITGGNSELDLFGTAVETNGLDVAGSINGVIATGSGQILTGAGNSSELIIKVTGGSIGARGDIDFAHGFASKLDQLIENMLDTSLIDNRIDGINSSIDDINSRREVLFRRLEDVETRIRNQFTSLDILIANMTQTSNFLQQQLANLPGTNNN